MEQIFDLVGGRKNFNCLVGVLLVILWQITGWAETALIMAVSLLGVTNASIAYEDGNRKEPITVHVEPTIESIDPMNNPV